MALVAERNRSEENNSDGRVLTGAFFEDSGSSSSMVNEVAGFIVKRWRTGEPSIQKKPLPNGSNGKGQSVKSSADTPGIPKSASVEKTRETLEARTTPLCGNGLSDAISEKHSRPTGFHSLPSGARLAYDLYGCADGFPVVFFHDCGSSRLEAQFIHDSASRQGFRVVSIDRPGVGRSDYFELNSPISYCEAVLHLLDALNIDEFGLVGLGAGGIFGLTMAHEYSQRVKFQICLAGVSGLVFNESQSRSYITTIWNRICPPVLRCLFKLKARFSPDLPSQSLVKFYECLSYTDRKALLKPEIVDRIAKDQKEATRAGCAGVAQDFANSFRRLGFSLKTISVPTAIWQGCSDRFSERADSEFMASRLPIATLHRIPNRGHFFFISEMDTVLRKAKNDFLDRGKPMELFA